MKRLEPQYRPPWYMGRVYYDFERNQNVLFPIPFNWVLWLSREVWLRLIRTPDGIVKRAWQDGYEKGYHDRDRLDKKGGANGRKA